MVFNYLLSGPNDRAV